MIRNRYLIAYDIAQNSSRRRALRLLRKHADTYQDSVFDLQLDRREVYALQQALFPLLGSGDALLTMQLQITASWQLGCGLLPVHGALTVIC